jgi:hypothetical protein
MGKRPKETPSPAIDSSTRTRLPRGCVRLGRPYSPFDPVREVARAIPNMPPDAQVRRASARPPPVGECGRGNSEHATHVNRGEQHLDGASVGSSMSTHVRQSHRASETSRGNRENRGQTCAPRSPAPSIPVTLGDRDTSAPRPRSSAHTFAGSPPGTYRDRPGPTQRGEHFIIEEGL